MNCQCQSCLFLWLLVLFLLLSQLLVLLVLLALQAKQKPIPKPWMCRLFWLPLYLQRGKLSWYSKLIIWNLWIFKLTTLEVFKFPPFVPIQFDCIKVNILYLRNCNYKLVLLSVPMAQWDFEFRLAFSRVRFVYQPSTSRPSLFRPPPSDHLHHGHFLSLRFSLFTEYDVNLWQLLPSPTDSGYICPEAYYKKERWAIKAMRVQFAPTGQGCWAYSFLIKI